MTRKLLLGTRNHGKVAELRALLKGLDVELESVDDLADPPSDPPEDAPSYAENAVFKARAYARATRLTTIADDSGLEVDALGGAPGVRSRRFFGEEATPAERNRMLLGLLDGVTDRTARFVAVIALADPDGRVETFDGEVRGEIAESPRGEDGFGYDPVFIIAEDGRTMAEVPREEKNAISHRGLAGAKLRAALATRQPLT
ncbi:MAG: RdgB/HAM1 family non-canonical purine NTP pyrophosphatase [Chloroflexota bacterium]|nr:RdgB/HAM1 family non-canonical purine NTP pyrophosphatase [Chloroflexota bacterium]